MRIGHGYGAWGVAYETRSLGIKNERFEMRHETMRLGHWYGAWHIAKWSMRHHWWNVGHGFVENEMKREVCKREMRDM